MRLASVLRGPQASSGFSLIEVLIALTLLGVALLLGMDLVLQNPRVVLRLDGERQAFRAMESTMEAVRAGVIPLKTCDPYQTCDPLKICDPHQTCHPCGMETAVGTPAPKNLTISMEVDDAALPGLHRVTLTAEYCVVNQIHKKKLQTMVWSPPA
jgi:prepilin-type N-terminal cleavage/methylation domain-containing protein